jgi:hypothetical protein
VSTRTGPREGINPSFGLVASEDTYNLLLPLPGNIAADDVALEGDMAPYVGPTDFEELFSRAVGGAFTLVIPTDIPTRRVIVQPLRLFVHNDWGRPHCS